MDPVKPRAFAGHLIDLFAELAFVEDYEIETLEGVVVRCRVRLARGFVDIYRNFETGTAAYAWVVDDTRVLGADNTGGWHRHPLDDPDDHVPCDPVPVEDFLRQVDKALESDSAPG